jgi:hypothetical protein
VNRLSRRMRQLSPALLIMTAMLMFMGVATAGASNSIEGVWSFNGGQIGVQRLSNGTYAGTVVAETKFASCIHPVGQQIWSDMVEQSDGSFHGLHQWYNAPPECKEDPKLGPTAWRVLTASSGSLYLRVCFSHPDTSQPLISATGAPKEESEFAAYDVTFGCYNSALIAPLPVTSGGKGKSETPGSPHNGESPTVESLTLASAKQCVRIKRFPIRLREPKYDPFKTVTITFRGHKIATSQKGEYIVAAINLKRLKKGSFTIHVHATTVLGHQLSMRRTYHICHKKKSKRRSKKG